MPTATALAASSMSWNVQAVPVELSPKATALDDISARFAAISVTRSNMRPGPFLKEVRHAILVYRGIELRDEGLGLG